MFEFFSCPVTDQQPKNVLPISVATRNFLFISFPLYFCPKRLFIEIVKQQWVVSSFFVVFGLVLNVGSWLIFIENLSLSCALLFWKVLEIMARNFLFAKYSQVTSRRH
jgi:hypothetical protein